MRESISKPDVMPNAQPAEAEIWVTAEPTKYNRRFGANNRRQREIEVFAMRYTLKHFTIPVAMLITALGMAQLPPQGGATQANAVPAHSANATFSSRTPRYLLRPGDSLELLFEFSPEFNQTVAVQPDGFVNLKGVGDIQIAGQTVAEVTQTVKRAYAAILSDPVVTAVLKDFEKPYFIANGQVAKPGKYELRGATSVTEAIAIAGGFNDSAKHSKVVVFHRVSNEWMEGKVIDVKKMLAQKSLGEDLSLQPGDMVFVPTSSYSKIRRYIPAPGIGMNLSPAY